MQRKKWMAAGLGVLGAISVAAQDAVNLLKSDFFAGESKIAESQGTFYVKGKGDGLLAGFADENRKAVGRLDMKLEKADDFITAGSTCLAVTIKPSGAAKEAVTGRFYGIPNDKVPAGKTCTVEIWLKGSADGLAGSLFFEGGTKDKKHFWRALPVVLTDKWKKYSYTQVLPENLSALWVRFSCNSAGTYRFNNPALFVADKAVACGLLPAVNLIVNGGAEQGWYRIGVSSRAETTPTSGKFIRWDGVILNNPYAKWTIDATAAASGKRSFKGEFPEPNGGINRFNFYPVPFEVGKPAVFSVKLKSDRKGQAAIGLFVSSGIAYGKQVAVGTEWQTYTLEIPVWGKEISGVARIGDVSTGYGCPLGLTYPQINLNTAGTLWIDDASYRLSLDKPVTAAEPVLLRGRLDHADAVYRPGQPVKAAYEIDNTLKEPVEVEIRYETADYFGRTVALGQPVKMTLKPESTVKQDYRFTPALLGAANLLMKVKALKTGKETVHSSYFGVCRKAEKLYPWYGIDLAYRQNAAAMAILLRDFGIGSVRLWDSYKKEAGRHLGFDDVKIYKDAGMYVMMNLGLTPASPEWNLVPTDPTAWAEQLTALVKPYRGLVDCYEILNEPNIWPAVKLNPDKAKYTFMSVNSYAKLVAAAAPAIRKVDPTVKIAGPTTCHTDVVWTANVLALGTGKYFDIVTEHPYRERPEAPDYAKDLDTLQKVIAKTGKKMPIFASECGNIIPASPDGDTVSAAVRDSVNKSIRTQLIALSCGVEKYIHFAANLGNEGTSWNIVYLGSPGNGGVSVPNPYLYAVRNMMEQLDGAKPLGKCELGTALRCYLFEKAGKRVAVLWKCQTEDIPSTVTLKAEKEPFKIVDAMGNPVPMTRQGFDFSFPVSGAPSYLESELDVEALQTLLTKASISGVGAPFVVSTAVIDQRRFAVDVENRINNAISGQLTVESATLAGGKTVRTFENISAGQKQRFVFDTVLPLDTNPQALKTRTSLQDGSSFAVNDFMLKTMLCRKATKPVMIDGNLDDWPANAEKVTLTDANAWTKDAPELWQPADKKITAEIRTAWRDDGLYLAVTVTKPVFCQKAKGPMELYLGDGLQVAFDPLKNGKVAPKREFLYDDDDFEYSIALMNGKPMVYRHHASSVVHDGLGKNIGLITGEVEAAVKTMDGKTVYEMKFPPSAVSPFRLEENNSMRWNCIVNLNNGKGRMGWLELTRGIGQCKSPGDFMELVLTR